MTKFNIASKFETDPSITALLFAAILVIFALHIRTLLREHKARIAKNAIGPETTTHQA